MLQDMHKVRSLFPFDIIELSSVDALMVFRVTPLRFLLPFLSELSGNNQLVKDVDEVNIKVVINSI
jgi:hypothetical protein